MPVRSRKGIAGGIGRKIGKESQAMLLIAFVGELFLTLTKLDTSDGDVRKFVVRNVFLDINNYMKSGIYLRQLINRIN